MIRHTVTAAIVTLFAINLYGLFWNVNRATAEPPNIAVRAPLGNGFSYQGYLESGSSPINMNCDFQFSLWDAPTGGSQIGAIQTLSETAVTNGRFTVQLNASNEIAAQPFSGQARYLLVAVRCPSGSGPFTTLEPRQPILATPYALSLQPGALISGTVDVDQGALNLASNYNGLYIENAGLHGIYIENAAKHGINVSTPGDNGLHVRQAANGVNVQQATGNGLLVNDAAANGVYVRRALSNGVQIDSYGNYGIQVEGGITETALYAGFFSGGIKVIGGCDGCSIRQSAVNRGSADLQPGTAVAIVAVETDHKLIDSAIMAVRPARPGEAAVGIVIGGAQPADHGDGRQTLSVSDLPAAPGDFLAILIYGITQAPADTLSRSAIGAGDRLVVGDGGLRPLQTTTVNGVRVAEAAATVGVALDAPDQDGNVWILVNPQ